MQVQLPPVPARPPCNEQGRCVPIASDSVEPGVVEQPAIIGTWRDPLPYFPNWGYIELLRNEPIRTISGLLRVRNKVVAPELYLELWREAFKHPLAAVELARRHGLRLLLTVGAELDTARGTSLDQDGSPCPTFKTFEAVYADRFVHGSQTPGLPDVELVLGLREPDGTRHAHYAQALLSRQDPANAQINVTLVCRDSKYNHLPTCAGQRFALGEDAW